MKKIWLIILCICAITGTVGCIQKVETESIAANEGEPYVVYVSNQAAYEGGILMGIDRVFCFDANSRQLVPLCTRAECSHVFDAEVSSDRTECPAAYLGKRATLYAIYKGRIWYLTETETTWEMWTADLSNENHRRQFEIDWSLSVSEIQNQPEVYSPEADYCFLSVQTPCVFYRDYLYMNQKKLVLHEDGVTTQFRVIRISLKDGTVEGLTEWMEGEKRCLELLGVHGDSLFYQMFSYDANGEFAGNKLLCRDLRTGEEEILEESRTPIDVCMDGEWMACFMIGEQGEKIYYLRELATGKIREFPGMEIDLRKAACCISNGKIIWNSWDEETETWTYVIYNIETEEWLISAPYEKWYSSWVNEGDFWFCYGRLDLQVVGELENNEDYDEYFYFTEEELAAGQEPARLK